MEDCSCDTIIQNDTAVFSCNFLLDDSQLLTGDFEGSVKMWSLPDGKLLCDYPAHSDYVNCVLYSSTMKSILSAADNGVIKVMVYIPYIAGIFRGYKCSWFSRIRHEPRTLKPRI